MKIENVVFKVECGTKIGTAFLISKNKAITAFHVVNNYENHDIFLTSISGERIKVKLSSIIDENYKKLDVALLILDHEIEIYNILNFVIYEDIPAGTKWTSRGYPESKSIMGDNLLEDNGNIVNQHLTSLRNNKIDIELEHKKKLSTYAGYSGAPILIDGDFIGLINQELLENNQSKELTGLTFKHIEKLLIEENIKFSKLQKYSDNPLRKILTIDWFIDHTKKSISDLGHRYTPKVNVDLPISINLEALTRTEKFKELYTNIFHRILSNIDKQNYSIKDQEVELYKIILDILPNFRSQLELTKYDLLRNVSSSELSGCIIEIISKLRKKIEQLQNFEENSKKDDQLLRNLNNLENSFVHLNKEIRSLSIDLFNGKVLFLTGDAGQGKSHLLGDFINNKIKNKGHILLLGQDFIEPSNIWYQILHKNLRINSSEDELLSIFETYAQLNNERFIFIIDAINEGEGRILWKKELNGFIQKIKNYKRIGLVLSLRSSYHKQITSNLSTDIKESLCNIRHLGFNGLEYDACKVFFEYFNIQTPRIPLLNPEFSNPLYLKIFCEGLKSKNLNYIPKGYNGISNIIDSYINGINLIISEQIDQETSLKLVNRSLNLIAKYQLEKQSNSLPYLEVKRLISEDLIQDIPEIEAKKFLDLMVKEGVLSKNIIYNQEDEIIYFTYERMGDYISANYLINKFKVFSELLDWLKSADESFINLNYSKGLWEALSVVVPKKYQIELFDFFELNNDNISDFKGIVIESLIWRDPSTIDKEKVLGFLVNNYFSVENWYNFINIIYQLIAEEDHPFNGDYLHSYLNSSSLADRDSFWTVFVTKELYECPAIERLINWCLDTHNKSFVDSSSLLKVSIGISWLFTSTNISFRNSVTKALTSILVDRLDVSLQLIKHFFNVNDPYVVERVLLSIYGSILSSNKLELLQLLANEIDTLFFKLEEGEEVYPNVFVRDYAKNVIKYNLYINKNLYSQSDINDINKRISVPYNSKLPEKLPTVEEIDKLYKPNEDDLKLNKYQYLNNKILHSMATEYGRGVCGYGDFGRYIFQAKFNRWRNILNVDLLSNFACQLIFEKYGYTFEKHGEFDHNVRFISRHENREERIGKKYQWLALYEVLAIVIDNYKYPANYWNWNSQEELIWLENINDLCLRPIDPTFRSNKLNSDYKKYINSLPKLDFHNWEGTLSSWTINEDLPNIASSIEFDIEGEQWLILNQNWNFIEPEKFGVHPQGNKKNLWIQLRSYFIVEQNYKEIENWLKNQHFMGNWMPEVNEYSDLFCREYYWHDSYKDQLRGNEWKEIYKYGEEKFLPNNTSVMLTAERHLRESLKEEDAYSFLAPCNLLVKKLAINYSEELGVWVDDTNKIIAFDPTIISSNSIKNIFAIRKLDLLKFLKENNLKVFWAAVGAKWYEGSYYESSGIPNKRLEFSSVLELDNGNVKGEPKRRIISY
ncbi:serine protease [Acinetobacter nematophilus]|uniref:Serine protease n=1 Tax=Acinetobacter nematophilus TaxID=2994642 RepID=A0A9X3DSG2_9GAMM|nr:serine protease [Acinetobacter nematophilus]MCX5467253.1 serine protease [Acinetobacter nematophilus]